MWPVVPENDTIPAKDEKEKKVPAESVEVRPGVTHHYPYHAIPIESQKYPDERLYLEAKRDYSAGGSRRRRCTRQSAFTGPRPAGSRAARTILGVLILRFAQVYPGYATHFGQPGQPKCFQPEKAT